jgi:hypothetical protein
MRTGSSTTSCEVAAPERVPDMTNPARGGSTKFSVAASTASTS